MIKLEKGYDYKISRLDEAIQIAQLILNDPNFYKRIAEKKRPFDQRYTDADATPGNIAKFMKLLDVTMTVNTYHRWWTHANAYTLTGVEGKMWVNTAKLGRSTPSIVATIIHDVGHLVDFLSPNEFHHGGNNPSGKENTFQFWIDELAQEMAKDILGLPGNDETPSEDKHHYPHAPWWKRLYKWTKKVLF